MFCSSGVSRTVVDPSMAYARHAPFDTGWRCSAHASMLAAVLQAAVYTARAGKGSQRRIKARTCHAPARRLARTTISLGPDEGILFGLRAIRCMA